MIWSRCTWDDWPAIKARLGLRIVEVIQGPGASTMIVAEQFQMSERSRLGSVMKRKSNTDRNVNYLAKQLDILTMRAEGAQGKAVRLVLRGGMRVDVIVQDGFLRMQISRLGQAPSNNEWDTTVKYMPYDLTPVDPVLFEHDGAQYMRGSWEFSE